MNFSDGTCQMWNDDIRNFSHCFKYWALDIVYPATLLAASVVYLVWGYWSYRNFKKANASSLEASDDEEPLITMNASSKELRFDYKNIANEFSRQSQSVRINSNHWDHLLRFLEFAILILQLFFSVHLISVRGPEPTFLLRAALYFQLLIICSFRLVFDDIAFLRENDAFNLFKHSVCIYHFVLFPNLLELLSQLGHDPLEMTPVFKYTLSTSVANLALVLIVCSMRFQFKAKHNVYYFGSDVRFCIEPICSILQTLTYSWVNDMFKIAANHAFNESHLWGLVKYDYAVNQVDKFRRQTRNLRSGLVYKLFLQFRKLFIYQILCGITCSALVFIPSVFLKHFLEYVSDPIGLPTPRAWYMILLMFSMKIVESMLTAFTLYLGKRIDLRVRTILINEIYSKALSMQLNTTKSAGAIINLMSSDSYSIGLTVGYLSTLPTSFIMIVLAIGLLYQNLGWSALVGAMIIIILIPLNYKSAATIGNYQKQVLRTMDSRISTMNEVLSNIRTIKNFAWEERFFENVMKTRSVEIANLKHKCWYWSLQNLLSSITPTLVTFGAFFCFTMIEKRNLTTSLAFTSLTLFNLLRQPLIDLAAWSSDMYQAKISLDRICEYLNSEDTRKYEILDSNAFLSPDLIGFENASFSWGRSSFGLENLNITFKANKLNVIVGATGSGKSSLLLALLGEMPLEGDGGKVFLPGFVPRKSFESDPASRISESVAYCAQSSWLINDTIKNNILHHSEYSKVRYEAVITACGLREDLKILSEDTEIGESGVVLSGGQKQRLSLARAIYSSSKYVLLDDCLSAVDADTSLWIYEKCLTGDLMKGRTCILVSHNVPLVMTRANYVVILDNGKIVDQGEPQQLIARGKLQKDTILDNVTVDNNHAEEHEGQNEPVTPDKLILDEYKAEGSIPLSTYRTYGHAIGNKWTWILILTLYISSQAVFISQTLWLRKWTASDDNSDTTHSPLFYVTMYLFIGVFYSVLTTIRVYYISLRGLSASSSIFEIVLEKVLRAKARFFDITPKGRIMNRFSKDIQSIDQELIKYGETTMMYLIHCFSTILMICFVTPKFICFAVLIVFTYQYYGKLYLSLSRELKRVESTTRSPIFQQFQETLTGIVSIRAFGDELRYLYHHLLKLDQNNKAYYYLWISNRWLMVRTDAVGALMLLLAGSFIILNVKSLDAGLAGLSLTYAMTFNSYAVWLIRSYVSVEMSMNSVERLQEYLTLEQEAAYELPTDALIDEKWPSEGSIVVKNLSLRYSSNLDPVIKNASFTINAREKVAIVGRTGAGKSTIISACFRFLEADDDSQLLIDGVEIRTLGLKKLRRSISLIPQDPILFSGTIRSNIDPFNEFTDEQVIESLRKVNLLTEECSAVSAFVDMIISEGGTNLSQGQKQLVCLARALLKNSKILLMDEATSSIDHGTDRIVQDTLRSSFSTSTVITIAHRMNSIIDYDKVLVLDKGRVKEYDTPANLLRNQKSLFFKLCQKSGEMDNLIQKAAEMQ